MLYDVNLKFGKNRQTKMLTNCMSQPDNDVEVHVGTGDHEEVFFVKRPVLESIKYFEKAFRFDSIHVQKGTQRMKAHLPEVSPAAFKLLLSWLWAGIDKPSKMNFSIHKVAEFLILADRLQIDALIPELFKLLINTVQKALFKTSGTTAEAEFYSETGAGYDFYETDSKEKNSETANGEDDWDTDNSEDDSETDTEEYEPSELKSVEQQVSEAYTSLTEMPYRFGIVHVIHMAMRHSKSCKPDILTLNMAESSFPADYLRWTAILPQCEGYTQWDGYKWDSKFSYGRYDSRDQILMPVLLENKKYSWPTDSHGQTLKICVPETGAGLRKSIRDFLQINFNQ